MPNTATYHLAISIATGEGYSFNSSGEAFNPAGTESQTVFTPTSFEITRNLSSKTITIDIPRLDDANETLSIALGSDVIMNEARVEYSIIVNDVRRTLLFGRISEATLTDAKMTLRVTSFFENLKYSKVVKISGICRNEFGDTACGFDRTAVTFDATITSIADDRLSFEISEVYDINQFQDGTLTLLFPDGRDLEMDVAVNDESKIFLWERLPELFVVGDVMPITQGCLKTQGSCQAYNNFDRFGALPQSGNWSPTVLNSIAGAES